MPGSSPGMTIFGGCIPGPWCGARGAVTASGSRQAVRERDDVANEGRVFWTGVRAAIWRAGLLTSCAAWARATGVRRIPPCPGLSHLSRLIPPIPLDPGQSRQESCPLVPPRRREARANQLDHLLPETGWIERSRKRHRGLLAHNRSGLHQNRSSPERLRRRSGVMSDRLPESIVQALRCRSTAAPTVPSASTHRDAERRGSRNGPARRKGVAGAAGSCAWSEGFSCSGYVCRGRSLE